MNAVTRVGSLNKFRNLSSSILRQPGTKVLVIYDVQLKNNEAPHVPLVINYDLPKAVEEYSHRFEHLFFNPFLFKLLNRSVGFPVR